MSWRKSLFSYYIRVFFFNTNSTLVCSKSHTWTQDATFVDFTGSSTLGDKYPRYSILQRENTQPVLPFYIPFLICRFPVPYLNLSISFSAHPCPSPFTLYCCSLKIGMRNILMIMCVVLERLFERIWRLDTLEVLGVHFLSPLDDSHHQLVLLQKSWGAIIASCIPLLFEVSIPKQGIQLPNHRCLTLDIFEHLLGVGEAAWGLVAFLRVSKMVLDTWVLPIMSRAFYVLDMTFNPRPEIFRAWMRNMHSSAFSIHSSVFLSLHRLDNEFSSRVSRFCSSIYLAYILLFHTVFLL